MASKKSRDLKSYAANVARRAGITAVEIGYSSKMTPWKKADDIWFGSRPDRLHRLRRPMDGELLELKTPPASALPDHHMWLVLVRQVEPGSRVRRDFAYDSRTSIPNIEELIHALFDISSSGREEPGRKITTDEILKKAEIIANLAEKRPS